MSYHAIVKVQVSLATNCDKQQVLVYTKDRKHHLQMDCPKEILKIMKGEPKKFFNAIIPHKAGMIELLDEAEWQDW